MNLLSPCKRGFVDDYFRLLLRLNLLNLFIIIVIDSRACAASKSYHTQVLSITATL